jgi:hypothetical protein
MPRAKKVVKEVTELQYRFRQVYALNQIDDVNTVEELKEKGIDDNLITVLLQLEVIEIVK